MRNLASTHQLASPKLGILRSYVQFGLGQLGALHADEEEFTGEIQLNGTLQRFSYR